MDWDKILATKLPIERTDSAKAQRVVLFEAFDPNRNGYLSVAEVDKGLTDLGLTPEPIGKNVILRAFQASKGVNKDDTGVGKDFIEKCEFRLFLVYLRRYMQLWQIFEQIDTSGDHRISIDEFKEAVGKIDALKAVVGNDVDATFHDIDKNGGGMVLFGELCEWALARMLSLEDKSEE